LSERIGRGKLGHEALGWSVSMSVVTHIFDKGKYIIMDENIMSDKELNGIVEAIEIIILESGNERNIKDVIKMVISVHLKNAYNVGYKEGKRDLIAALMKFL
jgi:hypothetical protein